MHSISDQLPSSRRVEAFTLIELLVVISIIAMLIAILLPSLQQARETARRAQCLANQRAVMLAARAYANDFDQYLPACSDIPDEGHSDPSGAADQWNTDGKLEPYGLPAVHSNDPGRLVQYCPSEPEPNAPWRAFRTTKPISYGTRHAYRDARTWPWFSMDDLPKPSKTIAYFEPTGYHAGALSYSTIGAQINAVRVDGHAESFNVPTSFNTWPFNPNIRDWWYDSRLLIHDYE